MITTQELAELAGVSQSTVSRSLQNSPRISVETRAKIQELAKQHGYIMKKKPKPLTDNGGIGIILYAGRIESALDLYLQYLSNELVKQIEKHNYYPVILSCNAGGNSFQYIQSIIEGNNIQGAVIINDHYDPALEQYLNNLNIPHIYTQYFSRPMKKSLNIVDVDHFTGGFIAANHLLSLGHRKIAALTSDGSDFDERTAGYCTALKYSGHICNPDWIVKTGLTYADGYRTMKENWEQLQGCTAFFAQTDLLGIAVINYLTDSGYAVPQRYSVIGFDGIYEGVYCRPELTTIIQPVSEIAESSINNLFQLLTQKYTSTTHFFVQPKLCLRNSTAHVFHQE